MDHSPGSIKDKAQKISRLKSCQANVIIKGMIYMTIQSIINEYLIIKVYLGKAKFYVYPSSQENFRSIGI